jgi:hypothetical protein
VSGKEGTTKEVCIMARSHLLKALRPARVSGRRRRRHGHHSSGGSGVDTNTSTSTTTNSTSSSQSHD